MDPNMERIFKLSDALTETDLKDARAILKSIMDKYPDGFAFLSELNKIPGNKFNVKLSQPVAEFMLAVRERYGDGELATAIIAKLMSESYK